MEEPPDNSAILVSLPIRQTMTTRRTDGLRKDRSKIRIAPPAIRSIIRNARAVPGPGQLRLIANASLLQQRDAEVVVENVRISIRSSVDAEIGPQRHEVPVAVVVDLRAVDQARPACAHFD